MDWAQILVIILAIFLAIFLALAVALLVLLIKLTKQIKSIAGSAQKTVDDIEKAIAGVGSLTSPVLLFRSVLNQIKKFKNDK
jgi:uncharacterized protein YoxC